MVFSLIAAGAAGLGSALLGKKSSDKAAKAAAEAAAAQAAARRKAAGYLQDMYGQTRDDFGDIIDTGDWARGQIRGYLGHDGDDRRRELMEGLQDNPGFAALQDYGTDRILDSAGAIGLRNSGGTLKALYDYGHRHLNDFYNQEMGYLGGLNAMGAGATSQLGGIGQGYGNAIARLHGAVGDAQAGGIIGAQNQRTAGMQGIGTALGYLGGRLGQQSFGGGSFGGFGFLGGGGSSRPFMDSGAFLTGMTG